MDKIKTNIAELLFCLAIKKKSYTTPTTIKLTNDFFSLQSFFEVIIFLIHFLQTLLTFNFLIVKGFKKKKTKLLVLNTVSYCWNSFLINQYFLCTPKKEEFEKVNI